MFTKTTLHLCVLSLATVINCIHNQSYDGISEKQHYASDQHNVEYDHEAFLGADEAKTFDQLPPEESKRRLGVIVDKIDTNNDDFITREELKDWILYTQKRYISEDVNRQWKQINPEDTPTIPWEKYQKMVYGFLENDHHPSDSEEALSYHNMLKRDRRRWSAADSDGDDQLTKEDLAVFLHPEESDHMREIVVLETMEDIDKDKDGKVSLKEYIGDMYQGEDEDEEPDWVKSEREQFNIYRDKDGDGVMDEEEVKEWIMPPNFDHADAEARHLIYEADADADEQLTKDEVMNKFDLFVGSQATDFGEALNRHDEF